MNVYLVNFSCREETITLVLMVRPKPGSNFSFRDPQTPKTLFVQINIPIHVFI